MKRVFCWMTVALFLLSLACTNKKTETVQQVDSQDSIIVNNTVTVDDQIHSGIDNGSEPLPEIETNCFLYLNKDSDICVQYNYDIIGQVYKIIRLGEKARYLKCFFNHPDYLIFGYETEEDLGPLYRISKYDDDYFELISSCVDFYAQDNFSTEKFLYVTTRNHDRYTLFYYDGNSSHEVFESDKEILVKCNQEQTLAYIANGNEWYRMDLSILPLEMELMFIGTDTSAYRENNADDYQAMADNDLFLRVAKDGEYSKKVELYRKGQYQETLVSNLPFGTKGPFGIQCDGDSVSFYIITRYDWQTAKYEQVPSESVWNFFKYSNGQLVEADTGLRFYGTTADNLLHYNKIYTVNDSVIVSGVNGDYEWKSYQVDVDGVIRQGSSLGRDYFPAKATVDKNGRELLILESPNPTHCLYAWQDGKLIELGDYGNGNVYEIGGLQLLCWTSNGYTPYYDNCFYTIALNQISFDEIEKSIIKHQTEKPVDWVVPYGTKTFLYGTPDGETFYWKDGSETSMNTVKVYRGRCYTFNSEGN